MSSRSANPAAEYMEQLAMEEKTSPVMHVVKFDAAKRRLTIERVYSNGRHELFAHMEFPQTTFDEDQEAFHEFATALGENILVDAPVARGLFEI